MSGRKGELEVRGRKSKLNEEMYPVFPGDDIACKTCVYKKKGIIGYKNAYCEKYPRGKPNSILL